jgi:hypothetical protein
MLRRRSGWMVEADQTLCALCQTNLLSHNGHVYPESQVRARTLGNAGMKVLRLHSIAVGKTYKDSSPCF